VAVDGAQAAAMERWGYLRAEMGAPAITTTATTTDCMAVSSRAITATIATSEDKHRETERERERERKRDKHSGHHIPRADRNQVECVATSVEIVLFQLEPVARPL
jgi:hypothetical protein